MNDAYKALSHPARRQILAQLREKAMSAGDIAETLEIAKPTLSGHLSVLKNADLVTVERQSQTLIYRINISVLEEALANLMDLFQITETALKSSWTEKRRKT